MREYSPWGYKNAFSVLHVHLLMTFENHAHIHNLDRLLGECMKTEIYVKSRTASIFGTRILVVLLHQRPLTTLLTLS